MEGDLIHIRHWLKPVAWLYGIGVQLRNKCFDAGLLQQASFELPIICIGNITVGGTGKTPHTEMLLKMLRKQFHLAVLSRGYKRKSKGFVLATPQSSMLDIGDEPWQMKQKFPDVTVAVDANRRRGIRRLLGGAVDPRPDVILLDDAFQHRYVKASLNILLTDYHRLMTDDTLLPAGRLREPVSAKERAHIVVVTKCPPKLKPMEYRVLQEQLDLRPFQKLFFSTFRYGKLKRLFGEQGAPAEELTPDAHVLLLTGIASPVQMLMDLHNFTRHITPLSFADHHEFTSADIEKIEKAFTAMQGNKRLIITTEKDAARLLLVHDLSTIVRHHIFVLPIEVEILRGQETEFRHAILEAITTPSA